MITVNEAFTTQDIDIAADGLGRDVELRRQVFNRDKPFGSHQILDFDVPVPHRGGFTIHRRTADRRADRGIGLAAILGGRSHRRYAFYGGIIQ
jgi:hypothetical protein